MADSVEQKSSLVLTCLFNILAEYVIHYSGEIKS
jgi:hypothetical protein